MSGSNAQEDMNSSNVSYFDRFKFDNEGVPTATSLAQEKVENSVINIYIEKSMDFPELRRGLHIDYLLNTLKNLPMSYEVMDCSRTWIVYWTLNSLAILNHELDSNTKIDVIQFLKRCQHPSGGFGGGPGQEPHLAPTYAAVNALCLIGTLDAYNVIDSDAMLNFLQKMKVGDGSFYMHEDGEIDMRSLYCGLVVASLLKIRDRDNLFEKSDEWIARCQTYEGGFSGSPGMEAHGGYTFCGICSLYLLDSLHKCDLQSLRRWILNRQTSLEGGFQGRTNKLVDSCYSFWLCGSLATLSDYIVERTPNGKNQWFLDKERLQEYLLVCCQHFYGGFIDKPTTSHDPYHTCYSLSGLSLIESREKGDEDSSTSEKLQELHPLYNLPVNAFRRAKEYFHEVT